ncbi:MAG TPA: hypothetical protein DIC50_06385 [Verrucomicrobia subdivision 3 bacterium]|nr:hypothetical protein [Limisphaerales bacterium]
MTPPARFAFSAAHQPPQRTTAGIKSLPAGTCCGFRIRRRGGCFTVSSVVRLRKGRRTGRG